MTTKKKGGIDDWFDPDIIEAVRDDEDGFFDTIELSYLDSGYYKARAFKSGWITLQYSSNPMDAIRGAKEKMRNAIN